jgi:trimeric autotransporter adhesin
LPEQISKANILVLDINGKMLQNVELLNVSGNQEVVINSNTLDAGMYFYTLLLNGKEVDTKKMFIIK